MNEYHEANRRHWDAAAVAWRELRERDALWKRCPSEPELAFRRRSPSVDPPVLPRSQWRSRSV